MTLEQLIKNIGDTAIRNKLVNWYGGGGSIYELNSMTIKDYALIYLSPTGTHSVQDNYTTYNLTLFYMDRLLADKSNDVQIYSTGIEVLKTVIRDLESLPGVLDVQKGYTVQNFTETEKMSDLVAGAYATINITVINNSDCE